MCKLGTEVHFSSLPPRLSAELSLLSAELSHYTGLYNWATLEKIVSMQFCEITMSHLSIFSLKKMKFKLQVVYSESTMVELRP